MKFSRKRGRKISVSQTIQEILHRRNISNVLKDEDLPVGEMGERIF